jgi:ABC-type bacteriocin/lantibiotic exporter with double-glycine peptidase domain
MLIDVPVVRQGGADECGAVCAQMVARTWLGEEAGRCARVGVTVNPGRGSRADDIVTGLRDAGLETFLQVGTLDQVERHLERGRPMIAGLVQAYRGGVRRTHYVVVAGADPEHGILAVVDPARGWRRYPYDGFQAEWEGSGYVLIVAAAATGDTEGGD